MDAASGPKATVWPPPLFFPVSVTKLLVMTTATLGLYQLYWFWRNWILVKSRERTRILPFIRAWFALWFAFSLFRRVYSEQPRSPAPLLLAIGWAVLVSSWWWLPDAYVWIGLANVLPLVPVQRLAIRRNAQAAPDHDRNERFTVWNWILIGAWGVFIILVVIGSFLPAPPA
jgi:hypothetical protein